MAKTSITVTTEIDLDIQTGAEWFASLDDEQQTQFFKEAARSAEKWPNNQQIQWMLVGAHLADCECSSEGARQMIRDLHYAMEDRLANPRPRREWTATIDPRTANLIPGGPSWRGS